MTNEINTTHELARELLKGPDVEFAISVDVSTCEEDSCRRAFGHNYIGLNDIKAEPLVLLFEGCLND